MIDLIGLAVKLAGVVFLLIATVGLIRFADPFQRMHAATKAGTLGAGLVLIGAMINKASLDATITGSLALVFLLLTIPVASHLLARAAYISGSELSGVGDADALRGTVDRADAPLERAMETLAFDAQPVSATAPVHRVATMPHYPADTMTYGPESLRDMVLPQSVRFAAVGEAAPSLAHRAAGFAARTALPLTAVVAIDTRYADQTANKTETMRLMRDKVSHWLPDLRKLSDELGVPIDLVYEEGDAEALMAGVGDLREFLVLPTDGWADHGIRVKTDHATREPDGLLRVCNMHPGPVMYAVDEAQSGPVAVQFDGSFNVWRGIDFALAQGLWSMTELRVYGYVDNESRREIEKRAAATPVPVRFISPDDSPVSDTLLPDTVASDAVAVILPDLPRPLRVHWYGNFWQDKVMPGWRGDVLVWT